MIIIVNVKNRIVISGQIRFWMISYLHFQIMIIAIYTKHIKCAIFM